ncbi:HAD-IA family hydrolase [Microbacterium sp. LWH12-1.2]|uniref:HAD-IA family hydrolase n=1 Tax=Microbacterium sp. LWH12-1.2 TaxID=3135259 RepID=UPI003444B433
MIRAVLFDLDGVVRHFDHDPDLENRHGLEQGLLAQIAFASPLIDEVTTGRITRAEWIARIGARTSTSAAEEWGRTPFRVDAEMTELADELRAAGVICAILTNGTDTIDAEAAQSGLTTHFDRIFNSADIGHAKPDRRAFVHVMESLHLSAERIFFTDDSPAKLVGANELGIKTHAFTDVHTLRVALHAAGLPIPHPGNTAVTRTA